MQSGFIRNSLARAEMGRKSENTLQEAGVNVCFCFVALTEHEQTGKSRANEAPQPKPNQSAFLAIRHAHSDTSSEIVPSARIWEEELQD